MQLMATDPSVQEQLKGAVAQCGLKLGHYIPPGRLRLLHLTRLTLQSSTALDQQITYSPFRKNSKMYFCLNKKLFVNKLAINKGLTKTKRG